MSMDKLLFGGLVQLEAGECFEFYKNQVQIYIKRIINTARYYMLYSIPYERIEFPEDTWNIIHFLIQHHVSLHSPDVRGDSFLSRIDQKSSEIRIVYRLAQRLYRSFPSQYPQPPPTWKHNRVLSADYQDFYSRSRVGSLESISIARDSLWTTLHPPSLPSDWLYISPSSAQWVHSTSSVGTWIYVVPVHYMSNFQWSIHVNDDRFDYHDMMFNVGFCKPNASILKESQDLFIAARDCVSIQSPRPPGSSRRFWKVGDSLYESEMDGFLPNNRNNNTLFKHEFRFFINSTADDDYSIYGAPGDYPLRLIWHISKLNIGIWHPYVKIYNTFLDHIHPIVSLRF